MRKLATLTLVVLLGATVLARGGIIGNHGKRVPPVPVEYEIGVHGDIDGLYPGERDVILATARNRSLHPVELVWVRAKSRRANPGCTRFNLKTRRKRIGKVLASHEQTRVRIKVRMRPSAPDACQGATFPLVYSAGAEALERDEEGE